MRILVTTTSSDIISQKTWVIRYIRLKMLQNILFMKYGRSKFKESSLNISESVRDSVIVMKVYG